MLVVLHHLKDLVFQLGVSPVHMEFAALGVDLFFVLSGFLMVLITDARPTGAAAFLRNRLARVVPLYWFMTFVVFSIAVLTPELLSSTRASLPDLIRSMLFIPYAREDGKMMPMLFLGWSLNYEMFFYLIFAASLCVSRAGRHVWLTVGVIGAAVTVGLIVAPPPTSLLGFYTNPKMLEFAAGMLIARMFLLAPPSRWLALAGLVVGSAWLVATPMLFVGAPSTFSATGACSVILLSTLTAERAGLVARWPPLVLVGDASYSLYLVHPLITQATVSLWRRLGDSDPIVALAAIPIAMALCIVAAVQCYRRIELPLSTAARSLLGARRRIVSAVGL